jgi:gamma-glutamylcyclotransferase (GGCT)/AIG2-like uncharacterized protein YtfP
MRSEAMQALLGHPAGGKRALLRGFRLAFTAYADDWAGGIADIVKDATGEVEGVVFEISPTDILRLDVYEGLTETLYRRRKVRVELESGADMEAVTYEVTRKRPHVPPSNPYLDAMVSGATEQGLSEGYINWLLQLYPDEPSPHRPPADEE